MKTSSLLYCMFYRLGIPTLSLVSDAKGKLWVDEVEDEKLVREQKQKRKELGEGAKETTWLMGLFLRAGKRTFSLVHQTVALSNVDAVYFEGLLLATHFEDLDDAVDVSEANVPSHA
ncbi:hypothetical protein DY000_02048585 [Brassica cretica]|uniref:Uncharacterized protein n=1 Tax=Brassica cretica TaxID=69181 RepID=A0ABQ7EQD7_BRACR|nr:hypothetical protein DY000_02048585 [Brassica cretica]